MKKSFKEILEKSDPDMIGYAIDSMKDDTVPEDAIVRIRERVAGSAVGNDKSSDPAKNTSNRKRSTLKRWIPIISAAACLVIVVGIMLGIGIYNRKSPATIIPFVRGQISSSAPIYYGDERSAGSHESQMEVNPFGLSVTAKLIETLPDTYTFFTDWNQKEYRLLRMSTVSLLKGVEMTDEFYYMIPVDFMTDFSRFNQFVIMDMAQFAYEYSVLFNKTQGKAEQLTLVLFGYGVYGYDSMGEKFMAFNNDGTFDETLWKSNSLWTSQTEHAQAPEDIITAENRARQDINGTTDRYVHLLKDITGRASEKLSEIKSFDNGVFVPTISPMVLSFSPEVQFHAVRFINGFATNEKISIWCKEWDGGEDDSFAETKAHFTEDDLKNLPDLPSAIATIAQEFDKGNITPPHIEKAGELDLWTHGIFGWYAKTKDGIVGLVRVTWQYRSGQMDDSYYIVDKNSDGVMSIDRDDLLEKLGEYEATYIFDGSYDKNGKILAEIAYY